MLGELLRSRWDGVRGGLLDTIDKFTDAELGYRVSPGAYSVGETMLHIAHEEDIEVRYGLMHELADLPPPYDSALCPSRASIKQVLEKAHRPTLAYLAAVIDSDLTAEIELAWGQLSRPIDMLWHTLEHETHHRGELSLTLRLLGRLGLDA